MRQDDGLVVGITGQSGGGKTLVASLLSKYGFNVIDADIVSRKVVERGQPALQELVDSFGRDILQPNGLLDRSKMATMAFSNRGKRSRLNAILFPHIIAEIEAQIQMLQNHEAKGVFLDAPTLLESGANRLCHKVVSVIAPRELRTMRLLHRDSITPEQVEARLDSQEEDDFYISKSDYVIYNQGKPHDLETQVLEMLSVFGLTAPKR